MYVVHVSKKLILKKVKSGNHQKSPAGHTLFTKLTIDLLTLFSIHNHQSAQLEVSYQILKSKDVGIPTNGSPNDETSCTLI